MEPLHITFTLLVQVLDDDSRPQLCPCEDSRMYFLIQIHHVAAHQLVMLTHHAKDLSWTAPKTCTTNVAAVWLAMHQLRSTTAVYWIRITWGSKKLCIFQIIFACFLHWRGVIFSFNLWLTLPSATEECMLVRWWTWRRHQDGKPWPGYETWATCWMNTCRLPRSLRYKIC